MSAYVQHLYNRECMWVAWVSKLTVTVCVRVCGREGEQASLCAREGIFFKPICDCTAWVYVFDYVCSRQEAGSITSRCWRKSRNSLSLLSLYQHPSESTVNSMKSDLSGCRKSNLSYNNICINQQLSRTLESTYWIHARKGDLNEAHCKNWKKGGKKSRKEIYKERGTTAYSQNSVLVRRATINRK